ncbi:hypothetical protein LSTR_LSTR014614 [Laodelphax striatellus]|uniref:Uncharacterized protein n=1 Tax=Laodelphax striatellus TaxID=195883 RepID=A0A482WS76_LAOST|nr:hypothetical protein LSTR_LSTR014614 [Laodelphax striatellus]
MRIEKKGQRDSGGERMTESVRKNEEKLEKKEEKKREVRGILSLNCPLLLNLIDKLTFEERGRNRESEGGLGSEKPEITADMSQVIQYWLCKKPHAVHLGVERSIVSVTEQPLQRDDRLQLDDKCVCMSTVLQPPFTPLILRVVAEGEGVV